MKVYNRVFLYKNTPFDRTGQNVCASFAAAEQSGQGKTLFDFLEEYKLPLDNPDEDGNDTQWYWNPNSTGTREKDGGFSLSQPFNRNETHIYVNFNPSSGLYPFGILDDMESVNYIAVFPTFKDGLGGQYFGKGLMNIEPLFYFAKLTNIIQPDYDDADENVPTSGKSMNRWTAEYEITLDRWNTYTQTPRTKDSTKHFIKRCFLMQATGTRTLLRGDDIDINGFDRYGLFPARTRTEPQHTREHWYESGFKWSAITDNPNGTVDKNCVIFAVMQMTSQTTTSGSAAIRLLTIEAEYDAPSLGSAENIINIIQNTNIAQYTDSGQIYKFDVEVMGVYAFRKQCFGVKTIQNDGTNWTLTTEKKVSWSGFHGVKDQTINVSFQSNHAALALINDNYNPQAQNVREYYFVDCSIGTPSTRIILPQSISMKQSSEFFVANTYFFGMRYEFSEWGGIIVYMEYNDVSLDVTGDFSIPMFNTLSAAEHTQREISHNLRYLQGGVQVVGGIASVVGGAYTGNALAVASGVQNAAQGVGTIAANAAETPPIPSLKGAGNGMITLSNQYGGIYFEFRLTKNIKALKSEYDNYGLDFGGKLLVERIFPFDIEELSVEKFNFIQAENVDFGQPDGEKEFPEHTREYLREAFSNGLRIWYDADAFAAR